MSIQNGDIISINANINTNNANINSNNAEPANAYVHVGPVYGKSVALDTLEKHLHVFYYSSKDLAIEINRRPVKLSRRLS